MKNGNRRFKTEEKGGFIGIPDDVKDAAERQKKAKKRDIRTRLKPENRRTGVEFGTEIQLAHKFIDLVKPIRCCDDTWYVYQDGKWKTIKKSGIIAKALDVQPKTNQSIRLAERILEHAKARCQIESSSFNSAVRFGFEGDHIILINVANGVVKLDLEQETCSLLVASPDYFFTSKLAARYDEDARCPWFKKTLRECLPDEQDRIAFISFFVTILIPDGRFETALACIGSGSDGKSTLVLDGIANMIGEATSALTLEEICETNSHMVHLLLSSILNVGSELNGVKIESSANFKRVSSAEPITGNPKHKEPFVFRPNTKLCFLANNSPSFSRGSDAESRRLLFVHFTQQFLDEKKDWQRKCLIRKELDGIFMLLLGKVFAVAKLRQLPRGGSNSEGIAEEFAVRNNFIKEFIERRCIIGGKELVTLRNDVDRELQVFAKEFGYVIALNQFSKKLGQLYPFIREWSRDARKRTIKGQQYLYIGLGLKDSMGSPNSKEAEQGGYLTHLTHT